MAHYTTLVRSLCVLVVLLAALSAHAQVSIIRPIGQPTSSDVIIARVEFIQNGSCQVTPTTVVTGNSIRTDVNLANCTPLLPFLASTSVPFGPLPAGTYTYEAYVSYSGGPATFVGRTMFVVLDAPVPVPSVATPLLILLAITLGALAMFALRRVT